MADRGGNVQLNTSIKPHFGTTSIPYRRGKDGASWWVIVLIKDLVIFLVLSGLILMHIVRMDPMVSNMEAKALVIGTWWRQHVVIALIKDLVIFFILGGLMLMHIVRRDQKVSNMEAKALDILEGELIRLRSRANTLEGRLESLDKFFSENERLSKEEFDRLYEDYDKRKIGSDGNVDLNEVAWLMKDIVTKETEKRAADGFERVDYALASTGASVTKHSVMAKVINILGIPIWFGWGNRVHHDSVRMLTPNFRHPGACFALHGNSGFVQIKLTEAIIPQAVTVERVINVIHGYILPLLITTCLLSNRRNRYAPKDCRVYGWFSRQKVTPDSRMYFLGNFTYDVEKSSPQTFNVSDSSGVVDIIRLDFTSNHGNLSCTCTYRFSVHGYICT